MSNQGTDFAANWSTGKKAKWLVALTCENMAVEGLVVDKATRKQMVAKTVKELENEQSNDA